MTEQDLEKWDDIMFSLLENELDSLSKDKYIREISNSEILADRWEQWQKTKFQNDEVLEPAFIESLKKKEERKVILWIPMGIAATVALFAVIFLFSSKKNIENDLVDSPTIDLEQTAVEDVDSTINTINKPIVVQVEVPTRMIPKSPSIEPTKTKYQPLPNNSINNDILVDVDSVPESNIDKLGTIVVNEKPEKPTVQDSTVLQELREIIAQKKRARGNDIVVQIEDNSSTVASNIDGAIKRTLGNYEIAGKRTRYSIIKEVCEENLYCYTLVIENNQNKTYLKL